MIFALLSNIKSKLMVGVSFYLFVPTAILHNGGIYTITVLRESHSGRIFTITCLAVRFFLIEVMVKLPYPLLFIRRI